MAAPTRIYIVRNATADIDAAPVRRPPAFFTTTRSIR